MIQDTETAAFHATSIEPVNTTVVRETTEIIEKEIGAID